MCPHDRLILWATAALILGVALVTLWVAQIGPYLDCRARGGTPYWRREWYQRYGMLMCEGPPHA